MRTAVFAYSHQGCRTARTAKECLREAELFCAQRLDEPDFCGIPKPSEAFYGEQFEKQDALIFVGACGIAVRQIAPSVKSKTADPAVVVIDELGKFVIPLLSGHIGGANALAGMLAEHLGAVPVITTATDINGRFSVDAWAARNGFRLSSMSDAKAVSAAILEQDIPVDCDFPVKGAYAAGTYPGTEGSVGICISFRKKQPFGRTLNLIPPVLHLGIGCRKDTPAEAIRQAVTEVLEENHMDGRAVKCAASIELKKEEAGLLQVCRENHWPITFYSAEALSALSGQFTPSEFVERVTGVSNVCERSACMGGNYLIVRKTARNGVTVAVAAENLEVQFG